MSSTTKLDNPHRSSILHYDQIGRLSQIWFSEVEDLGPNWCLDRVEWLDRSRLTLKGWKDIWDETGCASVLIGGVQNANREIGVPGDTIQNPAPNKISVPA